MSAALTLLRPIPGSLEAAVAKLRDELATTGIEHNSPAYAIVQIVSDAATFLVGSVGHRDDVSRAIRAHVRHGRDFTLLEQRGELVTADFVIAG